MDNTTTIITPRRVNSKSVPTGNESITSTHCDYSGTMDHRASKWTTTHLHSNHRSESSQKAHQQETNPSRQLIAITLTRWITEQTNGRPTTSTVITGLSHPQKLTNRKQMNHHITPTRGILPVVVPLFCFLYICSHFFSPLSKKRIRIASVLAGIACRLLNSALEMVW